MVTKQDLHNFKEWCKSILGFVQAGAEGKEIEYKRKGSEIWWSFNNADIDYLSFTTIEEYRIKPKTIKVNGFDVPEPIHENPKIGSLYFIPSLESENLHITRRWDGQGFDSIRLSRNICHATKEAAIAHAKALLGIDPNE